MPRYLDLRNLEACYGEDGNYMEIFRSVCFRAEAGRILGIFGPNGCGKSTLLRTIATESRKQSGTVSLCSDEVHQDLIRVSLVPQQYSESFFNWASLLNNLRITLPAVAAKWIENRKLIEKTRNALELDLHL